MALLLAVHFRPSGNTALIAAVVQAGFPFLVEVFDALFEHLLDDLIVGELILEGGDERADVLLPYALMM